MAEVFVAAAPGEEVRAHGLATALRSLGFDTASGVPAETEIAGLPDSAKCVIVLWSRAAAAAPLLAALAALAMQRGKLVSVELGADTAPALVHAAPRVDMSARDRGAFKRQFEAFIAEIEKLTPTESNSDALPDALATARVALLKRAPQQHHRRWATLGAFAAAVAALFIVGFGAGRVLNALRSGEFLVAPGPADAAPAEPAPEQARLASVPVRQVAPALSPALLEREAWRTFARRIDAAAAEDIKRRARSGDAGAQALACLGHMAGAEGFLPSPTAARAQCDAASAQDEPAGLYLSWILHRSAPHAGLSEATARERLGGAARRGWTNAQIEYALMLTPNGRGSLADQIEAGRLLLAAAEKGDPRGQYEYARWLRDSAAGPRDPTAAMPFLERAAESGQVDALHMLATLYRDGVGAPRDTARARTLYERAAQRNHPPSMFNLADMLRSGPPEDRAAAIALFQRLACMRDEHQIRPMAQRRLSALRASAACR